MQLSKRLEAVAGLVTPGLIPADIGTDHAYIPIFLVELGIAPGALAADVNPGPVARAREHILEHGLSQKIELRCTDGLDGFTEEEKVQSVILAGMGGALTIRILSNALPFPKTIQELILQPQSEIHLVRGFLREIGWSIVAENMVLEDGKFYPMLKAVAAANAPGETKRRAGLAASMDELELYFGPLLLGNRHSVLKQFLEREQSTQLKILQALKQGKSEEVKERIREVKEKLSRIEAAFACYEQEGN